MAFSFFCFELDFLVFGEVMERCRVCVHRGIT